MHLALAADRASKAFAPEPFGKLYQRSVYQTMRNMTGRLCRQLERAASKQAALGTTPHLRPLR